MIKTKLTYDKEITALLVVDPYNDFISEGARYGTASRALPKRKTVFPICCKF